MIRERVRVQVRGEFFNFTNTSNFGAPGTGLTGATFGVVSGTASAPRRVQLGMKLYF